MDYFAAVVLISLVSITFIMLGFIAGGDLSNSNGLRAFKEDSGALI